MRFLLPLLLIIAGSVLGFFIANPIYKNVLQLRAEVAAYDTAIASSSELKNTRDSLVDAYKKIKQEDKDRLTHLIPDKMSNLEFILEIEKMASSHGLSINNIKFEKQEIKKPVISNTAIVLEGDTVNPEDSIPYGTFPVEFETEGTYDTFILFLKDLEYNLRLTDIKSAAFTVPEPGVKLDEGMDPNVHIYKLKAETYWLK